jgi:hypothetical protein
VRDSGPAEPISHLAREEVEGVSRGRAQAELSAILYQMGIEQDRSKAVGLLVEAIGMVATTEETRVAGLGLEITGEYARRFEPGLKLKGGE